MIGGGPSSSVSWKHPSAGSEPALDLIRGRTAEIDQKFSISVFGFNLDAYNINHFQMLHDLGHSPQRFDATVADE